MMTLSVAVRWWLDSFGGIPMSRPVLDRIHEQIASRRLLDHPFYSAWSEGALTPAALQKYAEQYYHWVQAFPTWLSATHANTTDFEMRQEILENLIDEERGPENHPELWLRFCDALGLDRDAVRTADLLPETARAIAMMRTVCRDEPAVAGLAALYAYESQQPEVMKTKREGLRDKYGVATGHDYFAVHETADVEHSAGERRMIERHAAGHEAAVLRSAQTALDATYTILDGINRVRQN
jgi:pyrroloquinoline-quinone synthase